jgi:type VII secretion-associated serine protease mycosin
VGAVKLAGLAAIGSLSLASLAVTPVALAAPAARPQAKPTAPSRTPVKPAPTVTKTKIKTVAPPQQCDIAAGAPKSDMTDAPWPQKMLNFTDVWPFTEGQHVKLAVVDSGVDASHSQLPKMDSYDLTGTGKRDCAGHGTEVAGIIAAQDRRGDHVPFLGVAPKVHLISIKVATQGQNNNALLLATGIKRAAALGAKIICVSSQTANYAFLKDAVRQAQNAGALVVAAAGNTDPNKKDSEQALYPASYDGVMSVGAVGSDGKVSDFSDSKSRVSVVAPGNKVISTWPGNSYHRDDGTSFAAPYAAGTAALVESRFPALTAAQVKHRIEATADGSTSVGSGHGLVNPLRAVTAILPEEGAQGRPQPPAKAHPVALVRPDHEDPFTRTVALSVVGGALGVAGVVAAGGLIIPAGRRRNWRPSRRAASTDQDG